MQIVNEWPPNIELIRTKLSPTIDTVFCYGDVIYNPSGKDVPEDIKYHESIHMKQQGDSPDAWYAQYITDPSFRLSQELEAYGEQYLLLKKNISGKWLDWARESIAFALSGPTYGNMLSYGQADSKIRKYGLG